MIDKKVAKVYFCENCNYKCFNKTNFDKHLTTRKHNNLQNTDKKVAKVANDCKTFVCICGKSYKHRQSLFTHQSKCTYEPPINEKIIETSASQNAILEVVKKQQDQISQLTDAIKEIAPNLGNNNTTNTNSNNTNQFNINVFLNEDCKNAINMSDFIKSIEVSLEQLDLTKTKGLEKGITQVIMDNMNKLSVHERPLHCTDTKRETLYIKDNDKWEKDKDKEKIKEVIKKTQNKNYSALKKWTQENPNFMDDESKQAYYAKAISVAGKSLDGVDDKIIKNVCKHTYIKE
tara:strand:+ start:447 stop:1313 length:867 start_codon:yes stop_codon:yes gene_type:complete